MIKYICDRCGRPINSDYYYKININTCNKKTYPDFYYYNNYQLLSTNCADTTINFVPKEEDRIYCVDCKEKIEKFLEGDLE